MTSKIALRSGLAASAFFAMMSLSTAAHAQSNTAQPVARAANGEPEIIVTAQRREQRLADVPQSVSVIGGETLERQQATTFLDYAQLVPGLNITQDNPGESRVVIRGINTNSVGSTVSIYVDDVPFGSSGSLSNGGVLAGDFDTFDVARIEVLRGPQGTLYGSNALGGTLKFITAQPVLNEWHVRGQAGVEFLDGGETGGFGNAVLNVPLGTQGALRGSGFFRRNGGYIDASGRAGSNINGSDSYGGRASLLLEAAPGVTVRLMALAQDIRADSPSNYEVNAATLEPVNPLTGAASGNLARFERIAEFNDVSYRLYSGSLNWDFGAATLTSVTSYATLDQNQLSDISNTGNRNTANALYAPTAPGTIGLGFENDIDTNKFTQEIRFSSPDRDAGRMAVRRLLYRGSTARSSSDSSPSISPVRPCCRRQLTLGANTFPEFVQLTLGSTYREYAAFVSLTGHVTDRFDITAGGRYSSNSQHSTQVTAILAPPLDDQTAHRRRACSPGRLRRATSSTTMSSALCPRRQGLPARRPERRPARRARDFPDLVRGGHIDQLRSRPARGDSGPDVHLRRLDLPARLGRHPDHHRVHRSGDRHPVRRERQWPARAQLRRRVRRHPAAGTRPQPHRQPRLYRRRVARRHDPGARHSQSHRRTRRRSACPMRRNGRATLSGDYEWSIGTARAYVGANVRLVSRRTSGFSPSYRAAFGRLIELEGYETRRPARRRRFRPFLGRGLCPQRSPIPMGW